MDVIDEKKLVEVVVNPALDRLGQEIIPALQSALRTELAASLEQLSNIVAATVLSVQTIEEKSVADVMQIIRGFDGWTLTIKLTAPKVEEGKK